MCRDEIDGNTRDGAGAVEVKSDKRGSKVDQISPKGGSERPTLTEHETGTPTLKSRQTGSWVTSSPEYNIILSSPPLCGKHSIEGGIFVK